MQTQSASGSNVDFTGIPATAKRVTITFRGVSTNGSNPPIVQAGDSGGAETSGYVGKTGNTSYSTSYAWSAGIVVTATWNSGKTLDGTVVLNLQDATANAWMASVSTYDSGGIAMFGAGSKSLSGTLDRIRINAGGGSFDAGDISVDYDE